MRSQVNEGVAAYKAHGADAVIGLGGGAALDVAKAIALMATHPDRGGDPNAFRDVQAYRDGGGS